MQRFFLEDTIEIIKWKPKQISYLEDDNDVLAAAGGTEGAVDGSTANPDADVASPEDMLMDYDHSQSYSPATLDLMRRLREGVICFELVLAILDYINNMYITGAVLIFLPGWAAIFELLNFLKVSWGGLVCLHSHISILTLHPLPSPRHIPRLATNPSFCCCRCTRS